MSKKHPPEHLRLSNFIKNPTFDIERFFTDLATEKISVEMYLNKIELVVYDENGNLIDPSFDEMMSDADKSMEFNTWKEVYPEKIYDLYYKGTVAAEDFLKTGNPYDKIFQEGSFFLSEEKLFNLEQLFLKQDVLQDYNIKKRSEIILSKSYVVVNQASIKLNSTQYEVLKIMLFKKETQKHFTNVDINAFLPQDLEVVGVGKKSKFNFGEVFRSRNGSKAATLIKRFNENLYSLADFWFDANVIQE